MRTLIVMCSGNRESGGLPLYLNRHPDGELLAEKAAEGIYIEQYDRVLYTILEEADRSFGAREKILKAVGRRIPVEVVILPCRTSGPAASVYETLNRAEVWGEFAVRDSLNRIRLPEEHSGNFLAGLDMSEGDGEVFQVPSKSFIVVNEQQQVLDVVEKKLRSDIISVGLYGFKQAEDYRLAYERLNDPGYPLRGLYVSNIISYLIGYKQRVFHCVKTLEYEEWASRTAWKHLQMKYALGFIDLDRLSGTQYLTWSEEAILFKLKACVGSRHCLVFYTARNDVNVEHLRERLTNLGIPCAGILTGMSCSEEKYWIDRTEDFNQMEG